MDEGNRIILVGDFNSGYQLLCDWMSLFGLMNPIANQHGPYLMPHNRSRKDSLDVIFTSPHLKTIKSRYLSFGRLTGDHRGI